MYDLWHRRRIENPWEGLFGGASAREVAADAVALAPAGIFSAAESYSRDGRFLFAKHGKGRAAYAPMVVNPESQPSLMTIHGGMNSALDYTNWVVPERADDFNRAIDWLLDGRETIRVRGQRGLLVEHMEQAQSQRQLIHLVNLCPQPQSGCHVELYFPLQKQEIEVFSPPADIQPVWEVKQFEHKTRIEFDRLDVYAVVAIGARDHAE